MTTQLTKNTHGMTMQLQRLEAVHVLTLNNGDKDNLFTLDVLHEYHSVFDQIENYQGNSALLITCEHEKTFCNGINLEWLLAQESATIEEFVLTLEKLLFRLALLNVPTIACINGNCYAGGALLASACDFRIMRADKGRFCFPEVNIKIPFTTMTFTILELIGDKHTVKNLVLKGEPVTGEVCLEKNIVDALYPPEQLQEKALEFATMMASKDRHCYAVIKQGLRQSIANLQLAEVVT